MGLETEDGRQALAQFFVSTECEQNLSVSPLPFKFHAKHPLFASNLELFREENSGKYDSHLTKLT